MRFCYVDFSTISRVVVRCSCCCNWFPVFIRVFSAQLFCVLLYNLNICYTCAMCWIQDWMEHILWSEEDTHPYMSEQRENVPARARITIYSLDQSPAIVYVVMMCHQMLFRQMNWRLLFIHGRCINTSNSRQMCLLFSPQLSIHTSEQDATVQCMERALNEAKWKRKQK